MDVRGTILENKKHIHFIGIGGSGMFPLVQILHASGYYITGSDNNESDILQMNRDLGIPVVLGQKAENIEGADLIVHTAAIMADNPELIAAKSSGVPVIERSVLLGLLTEQFDNCICISGTHGKTTTTAMITQILLDAGIDPTAVIGGKLKSINGYGRLGHSEVMVCEACEFVDTFLKMAPDISIITNIDRDHMDYFKTMENLKRSFHRFAEKTTKTLIVNGDDANTMEVVADLHGQKEILTFGFSSQNNYYPENITQKDGLHSTFDLMYKKQKLVTLDLYIPGKHNVLNAVAACMSALQAGVSIEDLQKGLSNFKGAGRRFEFLGKVNGITIVDDYAHHPAEIEVTLKAALSLGFKRVWAVHQPFTYSRTSLLLEDFARVLALADRVVLSEIMGSREKNTYNIYASDLANKIPGAVWFPTFEEISEFIHDNAEAGDLVITLGCGDVYKAAKMILKG